MIQCTLDLPAVSSTVTALLFMVFFHMHPQFRIEDHRYHLREGAELLKRDAEPITEEGVLRKGGAGATSFTG